MPIETDALIGELIQGTVKAADKSATTESQKSDATTAAPAGAV
jgi:hypothetical protein